MVVQFRDLDADGQVTPLERSIQVWDDVGQITGQHRLQADPDAPPLHDELLAYAHALFGDLNGDSVVDAADIMYMLEHVNAVDPTPVQGDVNPDGAVDAVDLLVMVGAMGTVISLTDDQLIDGLMDMMNVYLLSDDADIAAIADAGDIGPLRPRISIRCYRIPAFPLAAHCALYDRDNDRVCGAGPQILAPPSGCIRGYCREYDGSAEQGMEGACVGDPLGCYRSTPIVCPDRAAGDALMQCVSDYMLSVNDGCVGYHFISGPNSNTTIHKALTCCLEDSGCSSPFTDGGRDPRTPPGTTPGGWAPGQGFDLLPPCVATE